MSATVPLVAGGQLRLAAGGGGVPGAGRGAGRISAAPIRAGPAGRGGGFLGQWKRGGPVALLYGADVAPRMESALSILKQGLPG